jgi:hypothetical protein
VHPSAVHASRPFVPVYVDNATSQPRSSHGRGPDDDADA